MVEISIPSVLKLSLKDQWDIRSTQRGVLTMEGGSVLTTEIPAIKGDKGDAGRDGTPPRFHEPIDEGELPNPRDLTLADVGWFWPIRNSTTVYQFNGFDLVPLENYLGSRGPLGPAPQLQIGSVRSATVPRVVATQDDDGIVTLDIDLPKGDPGTPGGKGDPGDSGKIADSLDYDDGGAPATVGDVLTMRPDGDWGPARPQIGAGSVKKSGADSDWQAIDTGSNWRGDHTIITRVTIPAQPFPYEPEVYGGIDCRIDGFMVRMDMEARLNAVSGPLLALGPGAQAEFFLDEWTYQQLVPAADETANFNDSSSVVPAGQAAEVILIARRIESMSGIRLRTRKERAYLRINVNPVRSE